MEQSRRAGHSFRRECRHFCERSALLPRTRLRRDRGPPGSLCPPGSSPSTARSGRAAAAATRPWGRRAVIRAQPAQACSTSGALTSRSRSPVRRDTFMLNLVSILRESLPTAAPAHRSPKHRRHTSAAQAWRGGAARRASSATRAAARRSSAASAGAWASPTRGPRSTTAWS